MTIDLSKEFKDIDQTEWESEQARQDYIHITVISALSLVVDDTLAWLGTNVRESRLNNIQAECRFYEASLMSIFAERVANEARCAWLGSGETR